MGKRVAGRISVRFMLISFSCLMAFVFIVSCEKSTGKNDQAQLLHRKNKLIKEGKFEQLVEEDDTLGMSLNFRSCFSDFYQVHILRFYKHQGGIFLNLEIWDVVGGIKEVKTAEPVKLDSQGEFSQRFGILLRETNFKSQNPLFEEESKRIFLTVGAFQKWGRRYPLPAFSDEIFDLKEMYREIMQELYPNMKEFFPVEVEVIIDDWQQEID